MVELRKRDLLACLVRWVGHRDKDNMDSHQLMSGNPKLFTLHHPPMVFSQFTVSQSMLNPGPSTLSPDLFTDSPSTLSPGPSTDSPSTLSQDLSTLNHSRSKATVSNSLIRLLVHIVPSHMVLPAPSVSQSPLFQSPQVESSMVLSAKSKRPLRVIAKQMSLRHLKFLRFQRLMTMPQRLQLLNFPVTVLSQVFLRHHLSRVAMAKHQLSLRCPLTQDLAKPPAMASQYKVATAHLVANVAAMVALALVVPREASAQEAASVLPRAALELPKAATAASVLPRAATAALANLRVDSEDPEEDLADPKVDTARPSVKTSSHSTANPRAADLAAPEADMAAPAADMAAPAADMVALAVSLVDPRAASEVQASENPEADMEADLAAPEADTAAREASAREASVDSKNKALEVKAAMALPEAVQVMVVDLVESAPTVVVDLVSRAPTVVDMAVPDMEAQEDGEELSFCVYGLNA